MISSCFLKVPPSWCSDGLLRRMWTTKCCYRDDGGGEKACGSRMGEWKPHITSVLGCQEEEENIFVHFLLFSCRWLCETKFVWLSRLLAHLSCSHEAEKVHWKFPLMRPIWHVHSCHIPSCLCNSCDALEPNSANKNKGNFFRRILSPRLKSTEYKDWFWTVFVGVRSPIWQEFIRGVSEKCNTTCGHWKIEHAGTAVVPYPGRIKHP